jgi:FkbM family methyltransferase
MMTAVLSCEEPMQRSTGDSANVQAEIRAALDAHRVRGVRRTDARIGGTGWTLQDVLHITRGPLDLDTVSDDLIAKWARTIGDAGVPRSRATLGGTRSVTVLAILLAVAVTCGVVGVGAQRVGKEWGRLVFLDEYTYAGFHRLPRHRKLAVSLRGAFNSSFYHSAYDQDRWVASVVFPDVTDGFYVDVGAGDGVRDSNTKALDDLGWQGIAIDPFPTSMETRTAQIFREVVFSEPGQVVVFRASDFTGGIESFFAHTRDWAVHKTADRIELVTTTLDDVLSRANAPSYIHYMSLDIEGAEYEALKGLSFSKYDVGAFTIEHNWEEPKRSQIRELLEREGYKNVFSLARDDFYVHTDVLRGQ